MVSATRSVAAGGFVVSISRAEHAAAVIAQLVEGAAPESRLGTKIELRKLCGVSVGTFNEAMKLAQSRGYITMRPGVGGGIFAARPSALVRLGNSFLALDGGATSVADAVRIRDALDPLLIEDALAHRTAKDLRAMRECLETMRASIAKDDSLTFVRANWTLHARIAAVSPNAMLRSVYISLLELIESHTLNVHAGEKIPLHDYISGRLVLHAALVDAIEARNVDRSLELIAEHNNTAQAPETRAKSSYWAH